MIEPASEQLYRLLAETTTDLITLYDLSGRRVYASPSVERVLGHVPAAPLASIHPDDRARTEAAVQEVVAGTPTVATFRHAHADGGWRWLEASGSLVEYRGAPHALVVTRDISERKRADDERLLAERRFRAFVDHATDGLLLFDAKGAIVDVNRRACENLGYARAELIGKSPSEFSEHATRSLPEIVKTLGAVKLLTLRSKHRRKDGSVFPVEVRLRAFEENGEAFGIAIVRDITEQLRAERELAESHKLLQAVVESTSDVVFAKDLSGRYLIVNGAATRMLGCTAESIIGRTVAELWDEASARTIEARDRRVLETGSQTFEEVLRIRGEQRTFVGTSNVYRDRDGHTIGIVGILRDVTELKQLEEQFRQAQKMDAVGRLAGGVAHDFNNLLMVINAYAEIVAGGLDVADPNREMVVEIGRAGEQAATLTRQLLAFSRKQVLQPRVLDAAALVRELARLLQRLLGETISLVLVLDDRLGRVRVDPSLFEQAITNLVVNARDAMPRGGTITIETRAETRAGDGRDIRPGAYVCVAVRDTGHGMEEAVRARVFEPFFTTKELGRGTGLGLAMVYGFVKQSGGHVDVESAPARGACFTIYLPRVEDDVEHARTPHEDEDPPTGSETVLLVEDEDTVRRVTRLALESLGYAVLEAADAAAACELAAAHPGAIELLLSDVVMPTATGPEVAARVEALRPDVRVVFMSGYAQGSAQFEAAGAAFLQKPFSLGALARTLRGALGR